MALKHHQAQARGKAAEWLALMVLVAKGYRIVARNFRVKGAELDLVALGPTWGGVAPIVFVEVRARQTVEDAAASVIAAKRRRIAHAAHIFIASHPAHAHRVQRFDVMLMGQTGWPHHLRNVWGEGGALNAL